jgi:predicted transcriptional regulator
MVKKFLMITPDDGADVLKSLSAPARLAILKLLHTQGPMNVNDIADHLGLPQSSTSTHINNLEENGMIRTEVHKARKGRQRDRSCHACGPVQRV